MTPKKIASAATHRFLRLRGNTIKHNRFYVIRKQLKEIQIGTIIIEVFSVVLAVLFALGVNEWRTNLANKELALNATAYILVEIESNKQEVEETIQNHHHLQADLEKALKLDDEGTPADLRIGYSHSVLSNTAWHSTLATQAVRFLDFESVKELSELYELQLVYADHGKSVFSEMGSVNYHKEGVSRAFLKATLFNVQVSLNIEESLVDGYNDFLAKRK